MKIKELTFTEDEVAMAKTNYAHNDNPCNGIACLSGIKEHKCFGCPLKNLTPYEKICYMQVRVEENK